MKPIQNENLLLVPQKMFTFFLLNTYAAFYDENKSNLINITGTTSFSLLKEIKQDVSLEAKQFLLFRTNEPIKTLPHSTSGSFLIRPFPRPQKFSDNKQIYNALKSKLTTKTSRIFTKSDDLAKYIFAGIIDYENKEVNQGYSEEDYFFVEHRVRYDGIGLFFKVETIF